ncbi:uncharacterized protein LOC107041915 [Diachasma alloeum]|uniref:uncharacterized protein LOC107041915 n=1 Tax=Diachasma alloeum TaxID=454923 RepID=UPI0007383F95|nr:uncharacterized protein LOC107041915 [Diachasma alloeum]
MEVEENGCLPFLDVLVQRNPDGTLGHQVYRKPTHTDRYLHANSHHHRSKKNSVISSLMYRALTISQPSNIDSEIDHLETALSNNEYKIQQIRRIKDSLQNKLSAPQEESRPEENQEKPKWPSWHT